jgi:hypothetical protein
MTANQIVPDRRVGLSSGGGIDQLRQWNSQTCDIKSTLSAATAIVARWPRMSA